MHADPSSVASIRVFADLTDDERAQLEVSLHTKVFPRGTAILSAEQPGEVVYFILSGTVRVSVTRSDGRQQVLALQGAGDAIGEMSVVDRDGRSADVVALESCRTLWMGREAFRAACSEIPQLSENMMKLLSARLRHANELILSLTAMNVAGRVARQLLSLAERYGVDAEGGGLTIPLRLTQSDLAGLVGASRERVNRATVAFRRRRLISVGERHRITVLDPAVLLELCR